jgi:tRNA(His) 5'-end guanylyltransferase
VFILPEEEVCNYFWWRQEDAIRNSIQAVGQANFSHKELMNKSCENIKQMLVEKNIKWEAYPKACQRGISVVKKPIKVKAENNPSIEVVRNRWTVDEDIPLFWENRDYIDRFLKREN